MNEKPSGTSLAVKNLPKPVTEQPEVIEADEEDGRTCKRQTLYLPFGVHDQLREVAFSKRKSQQKIIREALDMWFAEHGLPSWDEAKRTRE